jgi:hypothetical protein
LSYFEKITEVLSKRIRRLCVKYIPNLDVRQYFKSTPNILGAFASHYKQKSTTTASGVYKIKCKDCSSVYIGETGRALKLRIAKHKYNCKHYVIGKSAIADYNMEQKHVIEFDSSYLIHPEHNSMERQIAEALYIKKDYVFKSNSPSFTLLIF